MPHQVVPNLLTLIYFQSTHLGWGGLGPEHEQEKGGSTIDRSQISGVA